MGIESRPKRRRRGLIVEELPGKVVLFDSTNEKYIGLDRVPATVWKLCDGKNTVSQIVTKAKTKLKLKDDAEPIVNLALEKLSKHALLTQPVKIARGMTRRGLFGAAAAALIGITILDAKAFAGGGC